jgi:ribosomal protein S18 acetylase RimI-like enzyme
VLGYIVVQVNSITAHINKLAVAPEARRSGLATRLLQASQMLGVCCLHPLPKCAACMRC